MTTTIIIVILIVGLSIGLFFLIKKLSNVSDLGEDIYAEEGAITDFNDISKEKVEIIEDVVEKSDIKVKLAMITSKFYNFFNHQLQKLNQIKSNYAQKQAEKIKAKEKAIREAIEQDRLDQESQDKQYESNKSEVDTSHFELDNNYNNEQDKSTSDKMQKMETTDKEFEKKNPDTKATDFVEQLLSEVDAVSDPTTNEDISDTYYYEYMEKRYIDRIVANSKDIEAYKKLGDLYVDMRNYKDALESFQYVLKLKPNDTVANRRVKDISNRLGRTN